MYQIEYNANFDFILYKTPAYKRARNLTVQVEKDIRKIIASPIFHITIKLYRIYLFFARSLSLSFSLKNITEILKILLGFEKLAYIILCTREINFLSLSLFKFNPLAFDKVATFSFPLPSAESCYYTLDYSLQSN